jgi:DNA-binding transcriptional MocR family regulator
MTKSTFSDQHLAGQAQRHRAILDRVFRMGSVAISEMADQLGVSQATIRLDLDRLATRRLIERTHGGALASVVCLVQDGESGRSTPSSESLHRRSPSGATAPTPSLSPAQSLEISSANTWQDNQ